MPPKDCAYMDGMEYDVNKLQELSEGLPLIEWRVSEKYYHHPVWEGRTPFECLEAVDEEHMLRILYADLDKPLLIEPKHGRVIDGYHRLIKAYMYRISFLSARRLTESMMQEACVGRIPEGVVANQEVFGEE